MAQGSDRTGSLSFREEFRLRKFGFTYDNPKHFFSCQWQWPPAVYISIRVFLSLYTAGALITVCAMNANYTILRFLTIWTYILLTLHFTVTTVITIVHQVKRSKLNNKVQHDCKSRENPGFVDEEEMGRVQGKQPKDLEKGPHSSQASPRKEPGDNIMWYMKLSWLLSDIVHVFSVIVTVIYFTAIFPTLTVSDSELFNDTNVHAINSVFVLVDAAICARPVRFLHLVYPLMYGLVYIAFSVIVYEVSGTVIYNVLDYSQPLYPGVTVPGLALIVIPLLQLAFYGLYRLRLRLSKSQKM